MEKILRVNMKEKSIEEETTPAQYKFAGGKLLIDRILTNEVDPTCDPLGAGNKFIVCTGLMVGTMATTSGRLSVGCKSPLTGGIKEANSGGIVAQQMGKLGIKAIILEEIATKGDWFILKITADGAELISADGFTGLNNYELTEKLKAKYGENIGIVSIGKAGENCYKNSTCQVTSTNGYPARAAARGGVGAVMGSKGLKAIIFATSKGSTATYANQEKFKEAHKIFVEGVKGHPVSGQAMPALGTNVLVNVVNSIGALPVRNFSRGNWDKVENVCGEKIAEMQEQRGGKVGHACNAGCIIQCSNEIVDKDGKYVTSGMEYETVALFGPNCEIDDLDVIAKFDRACDDVGVDTMDCAASIAVAMEAGKIKFGDGQGALALVQEISKGTEFGKILGNGAAAVGKALNVERTPVVKGQAIAGYDPRALKGTGVTYATSPMGGDHTAGNTIGAPGIVPSEKPGNIELSGGLQVATATFDSLGMCIFSSFCTADPKYAVAVAEMVSALTGEEWSPDRVFGMGVECLQLEKEFNRKAGITAADDKLPSYFSTEKLEPTGAIFDFTSEELSKAVPF